MSVLTTFLKAMLALIVALIVVQVGLRIVRKWFRFPVPAFAGSLLDSNLRRRLYPPEQVIGRSGIGDGMRLLEVGCGSGAYTPFFARAVGPQGAVIGLDIQAGMLAQLRKKLSKPDNQDIQNVALCLASASRLPFANSCFDLTYLIAVLQEIPDRAAALDEIFRVLSPGGTLAITEALTDPDYPLKSTTKRLGTRAGFSFEAIEGNVWSYTARFRKPS